MKKIILMAAVLVSSMMTAQEDQITVFNGDEEILGNDYVFTSTSISNGDPDVLHLQITNVSEEDIRLKLRVESMENATTAIGYVQFCLDAFCFISVEPGKTVPPPNTETGEHGMLLEPGEFNSDQDHFYSTYPGVDTSLPVVYVLSIIEVEADGDVIGEPLRTFTYQYVPTASTTDFTNLQNIGVNIKNTVVKNTFDVDATVTAKLELFDVTGKKVSSNEVTNGANAIDLSGLNSAVYIARFTTEDNKTAQIRIVKN